MPVDLNAPSAGELLGASPDVTDGSKGARNLRGRKGLSERSDSVKPIEQPVKTRYEVRRNYLDQDRQTWKQHWLEVKQIFLPYSSRWLDDGGTQNRGTKKMQFITDNRPMLALRTMRAGMMAGITSPSRPWFRYQPEDESLKDAPGVSEWCAKATDAVHRVLARSNFYNAIDTFYGEIGAFGTAALGIYEQPFDARDRSQMLIDVNAYTIGEYWISAGKLGRVDTFIRKFKMTVRQIVEEFVGDPEDENHPDWLRISPSTRAAWRARKWETWIDVVHVIEPNRSYNPDKLGPAGMKSKSVYYEMGGDPDTLLAERGFPEQPVHVVRWEVNSGNVWGHGPAMYCLGDARQLMLQQKRKMQAIDKQVDPPLIGDANLKRTSVSMLPGDVTWLDGVSATSFGLKPLYEVKPDIAAMVQDIEEGTVKRIQRGMYEDVFQMLRTMDENLKAGITATEIDARKQEQLLELGPLLDRLTNEGLRPALDQVFDILVRRSREAWKYATAKQQPPANVEMYLPPPPPALSGQNLKIEYISILAQAVRMAEIQGINQVTQYVLQLAEIKPEALDKIDFDRAVSIIADRTSVPPDMIRSDDDVAGIRQQRAQAQQQAQQHDQAMQKVQAASQAVKALGSTPLGNGNALEQILGTQPGTQAGNQ